MMEQPSLATPAAPVLYELAGVEKSCEGPAERITILKNMNLTIRAGESLAVVGASGSGKSTLLHLLGALDVPTAGSVLFEGRSLPDMTPVEKAHFRNRKLGFVFQFHHLLPEFSTEENVAMQALIAGMDRHKALELARRALDRVGLGDRRNHRVTTLSGGERQRAAIARAILLEPRVLLADEPTGNLDQRTGDTVAELLLELNRTLGMTLVIVTHNRDMAGTLGRCLELRSGELYEEMRTRAAGAGAV
ncbi:ABC transporter ATP-binding protein [uncultured Bilophila sp.]|uniref:ABC transporter ATP-binding protein n=1 Tax=uncultured Bilophila sp. TaxID=529385 RepID=UPI0026DAF3E8|nr:ABC transporter ATP-binding protein [uncultured Bilophila sp.]